MFTREGIQRLTTLWSMALSGVIAFTLGCGDGGAPGVAERTGPASPMAPTTESESSTRGLPAAGPLDSPAPDGARVDPYALPDGLFRGSGDLTASSLTLPFFGSTSSTDPAFHAQQTGTGHNGFFEIFNTTNRRHALVAVTNGGGHAIRALNLGRGRGIWGQINNQSSSAQAVLGTTSGHGNAIHGLHVGDIQGSAGFFEIDNVSNNSSALFATTNGTGNAASFEIDNASSSSNAVFGHMIGSGNGILGVNDGTGNGVMGVNSGNGNAVYGLNKSRTHSAGRFYNENNFNTNVALYARTDGAGTAFAAFTAHASGSAGYFENLGNQNDTAALEAVNSGNGQALSLFSEGEPEILRVTSSHESGDFALFQVNDDHRIRFDRTGKGFFDGGTQTGGADLAESFAVDGVPSSYEPGDVLAISTSRNRAVTKSAESYSTRVIGVYATKPGVLLTGQSIDDPSGNRIPVAVTGVVPTKVTAENGAIRRGDILVSSSRAGYAMRGQSVEVQGMKLFPNGSIIGKALEPFEGPGTRKILVMVNVK